MENETKELERVFNRCWKEMLAKCYTCKCENHQGFSINLRHLHIFGKRFKKDLFNTINDICKPKQRESE